MRRTMSAHPFRTDVSIRYCSTEASPVKGFWEHSSGGGADLKPAEARPIDPKEMGRRLARALKEAGITPTELAYRLGYSEAGVRNWLLGTRAIPSKYLGAIARITGKPAGFFVEESETKGEYMGPEAELGAIPLTRSVPLVGRVSAGTPLLSDENLEGWILLPQGVDADFALRLHGDSMTRPDGTGFRDGQIVFCVHADRRPPQHGDMVVAELDGEYTVAWLLQAADGSWYLRKANPRYPDVHLRRLDRVRAVVVGYLGQQPRYPG